MTQLKLYFIIGLPEETDADVEAILEVAARCRELMLEELAPTGVIGNIHLGVNILIPKPYTGYQRQTMEEESVLRHRLRLLRRGVARMPNVSLGTMPIRQAVWQSYITKAGSDAAEVLEEAAAGTPLAAVLRRWADRIEPEVFGRAEGKLRWHFLRTG
jgi:radical SAM superfamily enzyme YgiQ (UPF0313 family)